MPAEATRRPVTAEIVLPVLNEQRVLEDSVRRLRQHLDTMDGFDIRIVIAENGSTDGTLDVARRLAQTLPGVAVAHLEVRGRGRALRKAWTESTADLVAYMDVDLSTDLAALRPLLELVASGRADVATGSRLAPGACVKRGMRRELISRAYNALLREALDMPVRDAQCGFKAARASVARALLPEIEDEGWFFDTELLARAHHAGFRVVELPVGWVEDRDSRVRVVPTALADLRGVQRLRRGGFRSINPGIGQPSEQRTPCIRGTSRRLHGRSVAFKNSLGIRVSVYQPFIERGVGGPLIERHDKPPFLSASARGPEVVNRPPSGDEPIADAKYFS